MLFLNTKGQVQRDANFDFIQADKNLYDPFFDGTKIEYRIKLEGNAYLKPNGNIFIGNDATLPDALLQLNPENKIILPNSARTFRLSIAPSNKLQYISTGIPTDEDSIKDQNGNTPNILNQLSHPWFGSQNVEVECFI